MSSELLEKKKNRPKPKKFSRPAKFSYPVTIKSVLKTVVAILRRPLQRFRAVHDQVAHESRGLLINEDYRERWSVSLAEYAHWFYADKRFLHSITWLGVPARKMIGDLWVYQEILHECRPDFVVEIGSLFGGSTLFLANVCDMLGHGQVISVDISRDVYQINHPRVSEVTGDCSAPEIVAQVRGMVGRGSVMVIHDADHSQSAVVRDLENYADLVTAGQYLVVEDGVVDLFNPQHSRMAKAFPEGGPLPAIQSFLKQHADLYELDRTRERFLLTSNPKGFLRRKPAASKVG